MTLPFRKPSLQPSGPIILALSLATVVLMMLCFLLPSTQFLQPGINIEMSPSTFTVEHIKNSLIVTIPAPPASVVFFGNRPMNLEKFHESLIEMQKEKGKFTLIIRADEQAFQWRVSEVTQMALELKIPVVMASAKKESDSTRQESN